MISAVDRATTRIESGVEPSGPEELEALLGEVWPVELAAPSRSGSPGLLTMIADD